jgi:hypothetical protein
LAEQDKHAFKWVLLSLHAALQGSCVCHLVTTAPPIGVATDRNTREWLAYFEESRLDRSAERPQVKIAELPDLLKRIRRCKSASDRSADSQISLSDQEFEWWREIHLELRNQFVHFTPRGWSIELSGIPDLVDLAVRIIRQIASKGWAFRHQDENWIINLSRTLDALVAAVAAHRST